MQCKKRENSSTCGAGGAASIRYFASGGGVLAVERRALDTLRGADDLAAVLALTLLAPEPRPRVPRHVGDVVRLTTITHVCNTHHETSLKIKYVSAAVKKKKRNLNTREQMAQQTALFAPARVI